MNAPRQQGGAFGELTNAFNSIPFVTRYLLASTVGVTVVGNLRIISPYKFFFSWPMIWKQFQFWRLITPFCFHGLGLSFLFNLYFLYTYSSQLESVTYVGRTADYIFFVIFQGVTQLIGGYFFNLPVLGEALMLSITYMWSQMFRDVNVSFMFGVRFKAVYLPWVLVAYDFLTTGRIPYLSLMGIATGHLYYFLNDVYPQAGGPRLIRTPNWLLGLFPPQRVAMGSFEGGSIRMNTTPQNGPASGSGGPTLRRGYNWGHGNRLGSD